MSQTFGTTCRAAVAAAVLLGTVAATAASASPHPDPPRHCVVTLHGAADVPTTRCGAAAETRAARSGTLLMTWYEDIDYGGDSTDIRSSAGPCDADGYGVSAISGILGLGWNDSISSYRTFNGCTVVQGFENEYYGGASHTWSGDQPYVGDEWNDRLSSLLMHA